MSIALTMASCPVSDYCGLNFLRFLASFCQNETLSRTIVLISRGFGRALTGGLPVEAFQLFCAACYLTSLGVSIPVAGRGLRFSRRRVRDRQRVKSVARPVWSAGQIRWHTSLEAETCVVPGAHCPPEITLRLGPFCQPAIIDCMWRWCSSVA
jgi:hypothetical protein